MPETINPALSAADVDRLERVLRGLLDLRISTNEREFNDAVAQGRWSQVSGLHGIGTGLLMAKRLFEDEFKALRSNAPSTPA